MTIHNHLNSSVNLKHIGVIGVIVIGCHCYRVSVLLSVGVIERQCYWVSVLLGVSVIGCRCYRVSLLSSVGVIERRCY